MRTPLVLALSISLAACAGGADGASDSAAGMADADPDRATSGGGVPSGYLARADREGGDVSSLEYDVSGDDWEVRTGLAHIVWSAADTASGSYVARAEFEQLEAPPHPEAFGIFVGGQDLQGAGQRYTYFLVRGTGEYLVKVREGGDTRDVAAWSRNEAVASQDESGKASYRLAVEVGADSVRFLVGDRRVAAVAKNAVPTDGVVGLRVNHNLHVRTGPVEIERR